MNKWQWNVIMAIVRIILDILSQLSGTGIKVNVKDVNILLDANNRGVLDND